eukprot:11713-Heterococcus_DN1.PRE.3
MSKTWRAGQCIRHRSTISYSTCIQYWYRTSLAHRHLCIWRACVSSVLCRRFDMPLERFNAQSAHLSLQDYESTASARAIQEQDEQGVTARCNAKRNFKKLHFHCSVRRRSTCNRQ